MSDTPAPLSETELAEIEQLFPLDHPAPETPRGRLMLGAVWRLIATVRALQQQQKDITSACDAAIRLGVPKGELFLRIKSILQDHAHAD